MMHVFSRSNLEMPEVKRSIYPGSSSGDLVGPINVEKFSDRLWQVTEAEKKKYYGSFRIAVGGPTETSPQESAKRPQYKRSELARKPEGQDESIAFEPMAYSGAPPEFYKDLFHVWAPRAILDFTACDLTPAFIAIESKLPYLGVMYTEDHMVAGYKHLSQLVFEAMCDESSPLHDAKLSALVHKNEKPNDEQANNKKKRPRKGTSKTKTEEENAGGEEQEQQEPAGEGVEESGKNDGEEKKTKKPKTESKSQSLDALMAQLQGLRKQ